MYSCTIRLDKVKVDPATMCVMLPGVSLAHAANLDASATFPCILWQDDRICRQNLILPGCSPVGRHLNVAIIPLGVCIVVESLSWPSYDLDRERRLIEDLRLDASRQ